MGGLRAALTFLTRLPIGGRAGAHPPPDAAVGWFPAAGALIGLAVGLVYAGLHHALPPLPAAAAALGLGALATGAFHHDGLADMADAFGGGWTPEQRLEILKDPRHGTYGVMALVTVALVQAAALASLGPAAGLAALVAANSAARAAAVGLMRWAPPAPRPGLGADYARGLSAAATVGALACGGAVAAVALGPRAPVALAGAAGAAAAVAALAARKIGGVTGDVLGAAEILAETAVLLSAAAASGSGWWAAG